ncbi:MAG: sodium:proton exchanger [Flavobacteriales bacterium]|nr:sodium:proton exchanger [Flavobacteriales bacterium]
MLEVLSTYHYIIIFSSVIIVSYFFSSFSKKSGVPSVLMLIALGIIVNIYIPFQDRFGFILEVLGTVGLILIVLDGALGLKLLRSKTGIILKSLFVSLITLVGTSYISALFLYYFFDLPIIHSLLLTVPLSILSSAILLPSIDSVEEKKREFLIYESTFSDIIGIIVFVTTLSFINPTTESSEVYGFIVSDLIGTTVFSIVISCFLIYLFQKLKGQAKLFLLISVLMILYAFGEMLNLSSLIIILMFGLIINNYKLFFRGVFFKLIDDDEKISEIIDDFKIVTLESAFVVRTFFFILFGWSIKISDLFDLKSFLIGLSIVTVIYLVRSITLFVFSGTFRFNKILPELFLAPRGLLTILLFYAIPKNLIESDINFEGVFLYVIIICCLVMTLVLISEKKKLEIQEAEDFEILDPVDKEEELVK